MKQRPAAEHLPASTSPRGCLVPGCQIDPKAMVICPGHWALLPSRISGPIWKAYEVSWSASHDLSEDGRLVANSKRHPSNEYKAVLRIALEWLEENTEIPHG